WILIWAIVHLAFGLSLSLGCEDFPLLLEMVFGILYIKLAFMFLGIDISIQTILNSLPRILDWVLEQQKQMRQNN
ncbi:hypothetical protein ACJX0J_015919, partial [Zea mays]